MEVKNCPCCGSESRKSHINVVDHMVSREEFVVSFCSECNLGITSPRPENIAPYYDSPAYASHSEQNKGLFGLMYGLVRAFAAGQKLRLIRGLTKKPKGSLLDYGCGVGVFAARAARAGWSVHGVELSDKARAAAKAKMPNAEISASRDELSESRYDAVTLFHVLEHLPDPKETLVWVRERLQPGGALVVAVPNWQSPDAKHYGPHWAAWDVPIHYWHFSKESMQQLARETGWFVEAIRPMRFDAFYVALLSEAYKNGSKNWLSAIYQGVRSNILGGRTNASSLVYVLRRSA